MSDQTDSSGGILSAGITGYLQLLVLCVIGYFFAFRGVLRHSKKGLGKKKQYMAIPGAYTARNGQPKEAAQEESIGDSPLKSLEDKYGKSPEVFYDEVARGYVVADPHNPENLISISLDDLKTLNGGVLPEGVAEQPGSEQTEEQHTETEQDNHTQQNRDLEPAAVPAAEPAPARQGVIGIEDFEDFQDDDAVDFELEQRNAQLADQQAMDFQQQEMAAAAGNGGDHAAMARQNRTIGAKKAKSLKRKDQKRAYHEYMRDVSAARRAEEEKYDQEFGDLIAMEREERAKRNEEAEREQKLRVQKQKEEEEKQKELKEEMRQRLHTLKSGEYLPISDPEESKIAHGLQDAFVVNDESFVVRLSNDDIRKLAESIKQSGSMSFEEMAKTLTDIKTRK